MMKLFVWESIDLGLWLDGMVVAVAKNKQAAIIAVLDKDMGIIKSDIHSARLKDALSASEPKVIDMSVSNAFVHYGGDA